MSCLFSTHFSQNEFSSHRQKVDIHDKLISRSCRNPTLEDQALARVHRLGQMKEVTTIRFYIRDSFEEVCLLAGHLFLLIQVVTIPEVASRLIKCQKVMELQESKRSLAGILLSPHDGGQADDGNQSELQVRNMYHCRSRHRQVHKLTWYRNLGL